MTTLTAAMRSRGAIKAEDGTWRMYCPVCQVDPTVDPTRTRALITSSGQAMCVGNCAPGAVRAALELDDITPDETTDGYRLLSIDEVMNAPDPEWLVDGIMPSEGLSVLYGAPGTFKSFLALDWALSAAAGIDWLGRTVKQRSVVYLAAEGSSGLKARIQSWLMAHDGADPAPRFRLLTDVVNMLDDEHVTRATAALGRLDAGCGLLVVDTMARSMVGGDENSSSDVGRFVAAVDHLRGDHAALVVHHSDKQGRAARGSNALEGAADMMCFIQRESKQPRFTLKSFKVKDGEQFDDIVLAVEPAGNSVYLSRHLDGQDRFDHRQAAVISVVAANPGISGNGIDRAVPGGRASTFEAIRSAELADRIYDTGSGWKVVQTAPELVQNHLPTATASGRNDALAAPTAESQVQTAFDSASASLADCGSQGRSSTGSPGSPLKGSPGNRSIDGGTDRLPGVGQ